MPGIARCYSGARGYGTVKAFPVSSQVIPESPGPPNLAPMGSVSISIMRCIILAVLIAAVAAAPYYRSNDETTKNSYIVKLKDGTHPTAFSKKLPFGVTVKCTWTKVFNGLAVETQDVSKLLSLEGVEYVEDDMVVRASSNWNFNRIAQSDIPVKRQGVDVPGDIYIVDTGIRHTHIEFDGRASNFYDYEGGNGNDCNGHGTHVAGTAGGNNVGQSAGSEVFSVRVLNCFGGGSISDVISGLEAIATGGKGGGVVNLSLGTGPNSAFDEAVREVVRAGYEAVVAAGNVNDDACNYSPARVAEATTVGANDNDGNKAVFSNHGPCVDIYQPGVNIFSASSDCDSCYVTLSGTSMAAAYESGVQAL
ncbi:aqualysin-1-like [Glandiceps talaboti]